MGSTILSLLKESESRLLAVDSPRLSAEVLVAEVLGCSRLTLVGDREREVDDRDLERIRELVGRRATGEPLAYILGRKEFYGLDFMVTPDTLIPRPETEHIIEAVEEHFPRDSRFRFADLGTGSGILAVTLAHLFTGSKGVAVDLSPGALNVAEKNALAHGVADRVEFRLGDFTERLFPDDSLDLIVSNPPYVPQQEFDEASREVVDFEPVTALVSGADGLDHIRAMLPRVTDALKTGGLFMMEIGYRQAEGVVRIITDYLSEYKEIQVLKDLAEHDRIVLLRK
ncbi:peptide chain release factor N(5)-glutamine methyltransferase [Pseudodesulfovibrio cashew]|uniref:Release factor glutamine methyltransferase n=1 Tax=Pseudodesulfovibrio cashew TaxID=2678688 RepID=A0A6I6JFQ0_9BACT|nr:peptide chain release factor N(5)-glutamine methyltransferase [Pseudodesulfovibrio cashew]QGY41001.1 peptide chain release factor N(5)-glutamine methyltransferase [Pseudodesulfovibrio cashew]